MAISGTLYLQGSKFQRIGGLYAASPVSVGDLVSAAGWLLAVDRNLILSATTNLKANYHVVFREIIKSKHQPDWTNIYNASVELHIGSDETDFKGSTLPNFLPGIGKPANWEYSVVMANCAFPTGLSNRVYTWKRENGKDSSGNSRDILRLTKMVPTLNIGSERVPEKFLSLLSTREQQDLMQFAQDILVHSGQTASWRGSAGCLTIRPADASSFFGRIPMGAEGTLEIARGIEDSSTSSSYCY